ncbi:tetratricopeptide repeat protein [Phormidesmis sp. 146-35]
MQILLQQLNWFNRERITLLVGSFALVLGAIEPWYNLPPHALEAFGINLSVINAGKVLAALFALIGFAFVFRLRIDRAPRLFFWSGIIAVLLVPYLVTTFSPTVTLVAKAYYEQGQQINKHVEVNFSQVQSQWKQNISLEQSSPITSTFFSIEDSRFFQLSLWDEIWTRGLGYSNHFFGFIGQGWVFTTIGLAIGLMAFYLGLADETLDRFLFDMGKVLPWVGLVAGIIAFSLLVPNLINHQLDTMFAKGEYHPVVTISRTLAASYPPLQGDEEFLQRRAAAGFYDGEPDLALINVAKGLERYHLRDYLKAEDYFQRALAIAPDQFFARQYLATAIVNQGVNYFNEGENRKPGAAIDRFEAALKIFPGHLEAMYDLMLARVVNGEFDQSSRVARQLIQDLSHFHKPSFALLGQAYLHSSWASYHNGDLKQAWKQYRQSIDNTAWDKPINEEALHPFDEGG